MLICEAPKSYTFKVIQRYLKKQVLLTMESLREVLSYNDNFKIVVIGAHVVGGSSDLL
jgi:hypothetical protein